MAAQSLLALLVCAFACALAAPAADYIPELPGWTGPTPSRHYSGFLTVGPNKDRHLHYYFVESERSPASDPVLLWLNGGPGSSSLIGLYTENGPFALNDESVTGNNTVPNLIRNPYSWSTLGSVLYLESPAGVGFSYCDNAADCWFDDTKTAQDSYDALLAFFTIKFPEYALNDFYITGESYAGIYIPTLVQQINLHPGTINLKGMAIGDGCTGDKTGTCSDQGVRITAEILFDNGLYSQDLRAEMLANCGDWTLPNAKCTELLNQMSTQAGNFNVYNLYDQCADDQKMFMEWFTRTETGALRNPNFHTKKFGKRKTLGFDARLAVNGALNDYVCGGERVMGLYLSRPEVISALHVSTSTPVFPFNYTSNVDSLLPAFPGLIAKYRTLIYSGNVDACVPYVDSEHWTRGLNLPVKQAWRPWNLKLSRGVITGGYVTTYGLNDFTFLTVKGAGHMVPQFQPVAALQMITSFLNNVPY